MREWNELFLDQMVWIVVGLAVVFLWLLIWNFIQGSKLRKMRKKYDLMMGGTGVEDLESLLIDLKLGQDRIEELQTKQDAEIAAIQGWLPKQKSKIGIKRYNAFGERGNDLSFSIAIVNDDKDGVVITGLYNRDGSYVYAKPLTKGESPHALSPEELEAIALAGLGE
ncbi:DUF4446 family protein [Paenibacillus aceti]|uniref:DUF4446 domain-containing protein n=1 Tax=Paenibacillus aceti TaxID=1820010 RepID=A0ABQ1W1B2_9BACL|nr:DUF4446 family protein [Paenibacillus aceti]GGG08474.1 hypothetical protein GCM10010913_32780 [Paenibacillus aceti]